MLDSDWMVSQALINNIDYSIYCQLVTCGMRTFI